MANVFILCNCLAVFPRNLGKGSQYVIKIIDLIFIHVTHTLFMFKAVQIQGIVGYLSQVLPFSHHQHLSRPLGVLTLPNFHYINTSGNK